MKAIAMKMAKEEFSSVEKEIKEAGFITRAVSISEDTPYFVSNFTGDLGSLGICHETAKYRFGRKAYEYFDKDILLDALDIIPMELKQTDLDKKIADVIECAKKLGLNAKVIFE